MGLDLDRWIEKVKNSEYLAEDELKGLCEYVRLWYLCGVVGIVEFDQGHFLLTSD